MSFTHPLKWPDGWPRTGGFKDAKFGTSEMGRLGISTDDWMVSTNLRLNLSGQPRGDQGDPGDPGVAVRARSKENEEQAMKIEIEPTGTIQEINGAPHRIWEGKTENGVPVKAWVAMVSPQTHDEAVNAEFARELREVRVENRAHAYDLRLFID